eukprot:14315050-Heterocapsa_arctica.AAC.1
MDFPKALGLEGEASAKVQDVKVLCFRRLKQALNLLAGSTFIDDNNQRAGLVPGQFNHRGRVLLQNMKTEEEAGSEWSANLETVASREHLVQLVELAREEAKHAA